MTAELGNEMARGTAICIGRPPETGSTPDIPGTAKVGQINLAFGPKGQMIFEGCTALVGNSCTIFESNPNLAPDCPVKLRASTSREENGDTPREVITIRYPEYTLTLDQGAHEVRRSDREGPINLTPTEFGLLNVFMGHSGRVISKSQVLEALEPGSSDYRKPTYVINLVAFLRNKIDGPDKGNTPSFLETKHGHGYGILGGMRQDPQ